MWNHLCDDGNYKKIAIKFINANRNEMRGKSVLEKIIILFSASNYFVSPSSSPHINE